MENQENETRKKPWSFWCAILGRLSEMNLKNSKLKVLLFSISQRICVIFFFHVRLTKIEKNSFALILLSFAGVCQHQEFCFLVKRGIFHFFSSLWTKDYTDPNQRVESHSIEILFFFFAFRLQFKQTMHRILFAVIYSATIWKTLILFDKV